MDGMTAYLKQEIRDGHNLEVAVAGLEALFPDLAEG
jgi:hypothetical protein